MTVHELIKILENYPQDLRVILSEELGASELDGGRIFTRTMNYVEYPPAWKHHPPTYNWEEPSNYQRKVISTEEVLVIS